MDAFRQARRIVNEQIQHGRLHYPFRVAKLYRDFEESSEADLSAPERDEVLKAVRFVVRRIDELPANRRDQQLVTECRRTLNASLSTDQ